MPAVDESSSEQQFYKADVITFAVWSARGLTTGRQTKYR